VSAEIRLADDQLRELARLVAQELGQGPTTAGNGLVDAATIAGELGVARSFVYANAAALGARRLSGGKTGRLRFDAAEARAAFARLQTPAQPTPAPRRRRRSSAGPQAGSILKVRT
jgi:hypothetical protein